MVSFFQSWPLIKLKTPYSRKEKDKSGGECFAAEIAVNSSWFENTVVHSDIVLSFVLTIAMEGLCEKHGEDARQNRVSWHFLDYF